MIINQDQIYITHVHRWMVLSLFQIIMNASFGTIHHRGRLQCEGLLCSYVFISIIKIGQWWVRPSFYMGLFVLERKHIHAATYIYLALTASFNLCNNTYLTRTLPYRWLPTPQYSVWQCWVIYQNTMQILINVVLTNMFWSDICGVD